MKVVIFGCGRTGTTLALQLRADGHDVSIIEMNPAALRRLGKDHGCRIVIGSGLDEDVLEQAGVRDCDYFFALTRGDNTNIMAGQIARIRYKVDKVCVKVADPQRAEAYRKIGYNVVNPAALSAGFMRAWATNMEYLPIDHYNVLIKELDF